MKRIVSVSIGSSKRNHTYRTELLGEEIEIKRVGTDGDINRAIQIMRELDGKVDAIGLGGISLYLSAGGREYLLRDALRITRNVTKTPIVDGCRIKNTLESGLVSFFEEKTGLKVSGRPGIIVCAVERYRLAESLIQAGCRLIIGDIIFVLELPIPLYSLRVLDRLGKVLLPVMCRVPIKYLYPTGKDQDREKQGKPSKFLSEAEIIAGDFHYIRKYLPKDLSNKIIITNTVTEADRQTLADRKASWLVTASPDLGGRSFGTNVLEAMVVALSGRRPEELTADDYGNFLKRLNLHPRVDRLN